MKVNKHYDLKTHVLIRMKRTLNNFEKLNGCSQQLCSEIKEIGLFVTLWVPQNGVTVYTEYDDGKNIHLSYLNN